MCIRDSPCGPAQAGRAGRRRGSDGAPEGLSLIHIYPLPDLVRTQATTTLGEVAQSRAPAVLLEIGYHDNAADAQWISENLTAIAQNLVLSLTEYFGVPFIWPMDPVDGVVRVGSGTLNLRERPERGAAIIASMPNGAAVQMCIRDRPWP